jgi:hypothetical protein
MPYIPVRIAKLRFRVKKDSVFFYVLTFVILSLATLNAGLESLTLSGVTTVDVTNQKAFIPIEWSSTEVADYITVTFRQDPAEGFGEIIAGEFPESLSGSSVMEVPRYAKPGLWRIQSIFLVLRNGNSYQYERDLIPYSTTLPIPPSMQNLAFTVSNSMRDDAPPMVESFEIDIGKLRRDPWGSLYAPCKMIVRDNLSGFDIAEIFFRPESPTQVGVKALLNRADFIYGVGGVVSDGTRSDYTGRVYFGNGDPAPSAIYSFATALIKDRAGNAAFISAQIPNQYSEQGLIVEAVASGETPFEGLQFQIPSGLASIPQDPPYSKEAWGLSGASGASSGGGGNGGPAPIEKSKKKISKGKSSSLKKSSGESSKKSSSKKSGSKKKPAAKKK